MAFDNFVEEAVGVEVLQGEVAVEHLRRLELGDDGKHVAGQTLETFFEFTRKPVFAQNVSIDVAGGDEEERYAPPGCNPSFLPPLHGALGQFHGAVRFGQPGAQGCVRTGLLGQLFVLLQSGHVFAAGIIVHEADLHEQQDAFFVVLLGELQDPVVFAQVIRVRHVGGERAASVPNAIAIFHTKAADSLQEVGEFLLREVLHLVAENADIRATGADGSPVQRNEGKIEACEESHGVRPLGIDVVHAVAPSLRRLLIDNIMDAHLPAQHG